MTDPIEARFKMLEGRVDHTETEISRSNRRIESLEKRHQDYLSGVQKLGTKIVDYQREMGNKFAELMGRIDAQSRPRFKSYTDDDADEISDCFDSDSLRNKARAQRAKARRMQRMARGLPPAFAVLAVVIVELIQFLIRK